MHTSIPVPVANANLLFTVWCRACPVAACLILTPTWADTAQADLVVYLDGFTHERGQAIGNLFREGDDIFGTPHTRVTVPIQQGKATLEFPGVKPGNYAITAFHDENGNDTLDHNLLRLPAEPLAFSAGFKLSALSGKPGFKKLRFAFTLDSKPLEISVK